MHIVTPAAALADEKPILSVRNLHKIYNEGKKNEVRAVDDISFSIYPGETFGLVGESGSGKSTTGRTVIKLEELTSGTVMYKGKDITKIRSSSEMMAFRKSMQMIFQDPFNSLNPRMDIFRIISEPLDIHFKKMARQKKRDRVAELLETVGLKADYMARYPHEFSGGQRQRIGIARALAVEPDFIICDEPVSALDVSVQAQIINLLQNLREEMNLTFLFVAHDIAVVEYLSDRIMVMTGGKIVEQGDSREVCAHPKHPYTQKLIAAVPKF